MTANLIFLLTVEIKLDKKIAWCLAKGHPVPSMALYTLVLADIDCLSSIQTNDDRLLQRLQVLAAVRSDHDSRMSRLAGRWSCRIPDCPTGREVPSEISDELFAMLVRNENKETGLPQPGCEKVRKLLCYAHAAEAKRKLLPERLQWPTEAASEDLLRHHATLALSIGIGSDPTNSSFYNSLLEEREAYHPLPASFEEDWKEGRMDGPRFRPYA
jgi:hypothetical protein